MNARPQLFGRDVLRIHCIGVAGMGVGPLAIYLAGRGFTVTGEDDNLVEAMRLQLERAGVTLTDSGTLPADCELVTYSSAVPTEHPAYAAAKARGLPLVRRGELLAEVTRDRKLVAVCGSHGKTTTTAMLVAALRAARFPAGYVLGGLFADASLAPASAGENEWVVAEIDESDGTIEQFSPEVTVATNLDWDHPDRYRTPQEIQAAFEALFGRTRQAVLLNGACALSGDVLKRQAAANAAGGQDGPAYHTFGIDRDFAGRIQTQDSGVLRLDLGGRFRISHAEVRARGEFNALNATAALAATQVIGANLFSSQLADYPGVRRRQSVLHASGGLVVIEDYAHHPAEIRALLASLRGPEVGRLLVVFQPHRFSRTAQFRSEFADALSSADRVYLLDVYGAGETAIEGGRASDIFGELRVLVPSRPVRYVANHGDWILNALGRDVRSGDCVAFVGAGDIDQHARAWVASLSAQAERAARWDRVALRLRAGVSSATRVSREEPLAEKTTLRVGGAARLFAEPATLEDLRVLLDTAATERIPVYPLGRGSNLLVPDDGVEGLVLSMGHAAWQTFEPRADGRVWVGAGLRLKNLCGLARKAGMVGFEFLEGIPGNIGGALRMNAGAMGGWMFDVVVEVQLMTLKGELKTLARSDMHVDYRHCAELHDAIAIGALLQPKSLGAPSEEIARQIDAYRDKRQKSQPREPSAGCIFKNPANNAAGRLIDVTGLKGLRVGDAEVSPVHANFIVNRGHATSDDVMELVRRIRACVQPAQGVLLEPEVLLYGKDWKEVL